MQRKELRKKEMKGQSIMRGGKKQVRGLNKEGEEMREGSKIMLDMQERQQGSERIKAKIEGRKKSSKGGIRRN